MKIREIRWNTEKDRLLGLEEGRGEIGLAECAVAIEEGHILDDLPNPTRGNQRMFVIELNGYAYVVPHVVDQDWIFLKTMFPSGKHSMKYLGH
jgi:hypothetical protein